MAIIFKGESECPICQKVIEISDEEVVFPAFLNQTHPLYRYSDEVFHKHCFESSPDRDEVERLYSRFREIWTTRPLDLKTVEEMEAWGKSAFRDFGN